MVIEALNKTRFFVKKLLRAPYIYLRRIPLRIKRWTSLLKAEYAARRAFPQLVETLKNSEQINVLFFVYHSSVWKYSEIYKLLNQNHRFNVAIAVIPQILEGEFDSTLFQNTLKYFKQNRYTIETTLSEDGHTWLDIKESFKPNLVFYSAPYDYTLEQYQSNNFQDCLSCYVNYAINIVGAYEFVYNSFFHRTLWKYFVETKIHETFAKEYSLFNKNNIVVSGYPGMDTVLVRGYRPKNVWKKCTTAQKRIIWAPHHSIKGPRDFKLKFGCFQFVAEEFLEYAKQNTSVQFAFKPHPVLKSRLYEDSNWGKEKTDAFYDSWANMPNGQLEEGEYLDLFATSDAMILDSASFTAEYLYFNKPLQFVLRDDEVRSRFNTFGKEVFDSMYHANGIEEIIKFVEGVVVEENDYMQKERQEFFTSKLQKDAKILSSKVIYNHLLKELSH